jgi:hypothetical protein
MPRESFANGAAQVPTAHPTKKRSPAPPRRGCSYWIFRGRF